MSEDMTLPKSTLIRLRAQVRGAAEVYRRARVAMRELLPTGQRVTVNGAWTGVVVDYGTPLDGCVVVSPDDPNVCPDWMKDGTGNRVVVRIDYIELEG